MNDIILNTILIILYLASCTAETRGIPWAMVYLQVINIGNDVYLGKYYWHTSCSRYIQMKECSDSIFSTEAHLQHALL